MGCELGEEREGKPGRGQTWGVGAHGLGSFTCIPKAGRDWNPSWVIGCPCGSEVQGQEGRWPVSTGCAGVLLGEAAGSGQQRWPHREDPGRRRAVTQHETEPGESRTVLTSGAGAWPAGGGTAPRKPGAQGARRDKKEVGARRCLWGSACQGFSRESLSPVGTWPAQPPGRGSQQAGGQEGGEHHSSQSR